MQNQLPQQPSPQWYPQWPQQQPMMPSPQFYPPPVMIASVRPVNESMKMTAIILFVVSFLCGIIGVPTTVILIGIPILIIGFICHIIAFVCLCLV
jgi:hypothetical protein